MAGNSLGAMSSLTLLLSVLSSSPALSQDRRACEAEGVSLRVRTEVITILNGLRKICQTSRGPEIVEGDDTVVVSGVGGHTYQLCVKEGILDILSLSELKGGLTLEDLRRDLNAQYSTLTDRCVATARTTGLNFQLPKGVRFIPFSQGLQRNGIVMVHTVDTGKVRMYVEGGNFIVGPDGTYYLQNPVTGERLLSGNKKLEDFVVALSAKISALESKPSNIRQLIIDTAKEVQ